MVYFLVIVIIIVLDSFSKELAKKKIPLGEKREWLHNKVYFWHIKNKGIAYNRFQKHTKLVLWGTGGVILLLFGFFIQVLRIGSKGLKSGIAMMLGGALGNFLDRRENGSVTDFLYVEGKHTPIFNIADLFIWIGSVVTLLSIWREK